MEYNLKNEFLEVVIGEVDWYIYRWKRIFDNERESCCLVENVFIIDFFWSRVLDDVLIIEELVNGYFKVGVYIVDVFYYVREGIKIDDEVCKRGILYYGGSFYGDCEVMFMFFLVFSYDICSLLLNKERCVVLVYLKLDKYGCI